MLGGAWAQSENINISSLYSWQCRKIIVGMSIFLERTLLVIILIPSYTTHLAVLSRWMSSKNLQSWSSLLSNQRGLWCYSQDTILCACTQPYHHKFFPSTLCHQTWDDFPKSDCETYILIHVIRLLKEDSYLINTEAFAGYTSCFLCLDVSQYH